MSWSASDKLTKQVRVELDQLSHLVQEYLPLIPTAENKPPSKVEISALAAFLHSFYTGIENIFGRIYIELNGRKASGESWHKELLCSMTDKKFGPLISKELCTILSGYLTFRHVFRQAYTFDLRWEKMQPLVLKCNDTLNQLSDELSARFDLG
jgi:hypothetical protein